MRSSIAKQKNSTAHDTNYVALLIAILYPIEITPEQAIRAAYTKRKLPRANRITRKMIRECIVYIQQNPGWKIDDLGQKYKVNSYELYTVIRKTVQKKEPR